MPLLGALVTGAGVVTSFTGQTQLDEFIVIGDVDTAVPIQGMAIDVRGKTFINLVGVQTLIAAFAKWKMKAIQGSAVVGMVIRVATGRVVGNTNYRFTNAGATTPNIFAFSDNDNGVPIEAGTQTINANSNNIFAQFGALFIQTPANVSTYEIIFRNGYSVVLTPTEAAAYFAMQYDSETDGLLGGVTVIDNSDQKFESIRINTTAAAVVVMTVKLPQEAFNALKKGL